MTSHFDHLAEMCDVLENFQGSSDWKKPDWLIPELEEAIRFTIDMAFEEAKEKDPKKLNFEEWNKKLGDMYRTLYPEFVDLAVKGSFLNDAHSVLDHTVYHLRVFSNKVEKLIYGFGDEIRYRQEGRDHWTLRRDELKKMGRDFPEKKELFKKLESLVMW